MKVSLNWLSNYVDLSGLTVNEIREQLTKCGQEVEGLEVIDEIEGLVVGKVLTCTMHPDSDHLHVTTVDTGKEVLDIVCGAPNCREGLKVIVATNGTKLPDGTIKPSTIRGVASNGMLCSLKELGIEDDMLPEDSCSHNGIEELGDSFNIGDTNILEKLGFKNAVLDINVLPNRPDLLSMFGMAKEFGAILNRKVTLPDYKGKANVGNGSSFKLSSESKNCPYFEAKVINYVKIGPSPKWMADNLRAAGVKSINNLVDISNYVMLETGQPMHFYDLRSNPSREIIVKDNIDGEYTALDGVTYKLQPGDLVITSNGENKGIAGIMGGDDSKIMDDTTGIIVESALFDYATIRKTSNRLGLQTEAALRFSKGLDPLAQSKAMDRAVQLLIEYCDGKDLEETVKYGEVNYKPYTVTETLSHLNNLIGKTYTLDETVDVLKRLDFNPEVNGEEIVSHIPSYRSMDIKLPCDIDEEVARMTDFNDLKSTLPNLETTVGKLTKKQSIRRVIQDELNSLGIYDTVSYTLVDKKYIDNACLSDNNAIRLLHPLSDNRMYIRNSLMNSMIETLKYNVDHKNSNVNLFELSTVYNVEGDAEDRLGIILSGNLQESKVLHLNTQVNFYTIKGIIKLLLSKLGYEDGRVQVVENTIDTTHFNPYQSAVVKVNNEVFGIIGNLHPSFINDRKMPDIYYGEFKLDSLYKSNPSKVKLNEINKFPSVSRDISVLLNNNVLIKDLLADAKKLGGKLVNDAKIIDIYKGNNIKEGYSSVTVNINVESFDHTLSADEINDVYNKVFNGLNDKYSNK